MVATENLVILLSESGQVWLKCVHCPAWRENGSLMSPGFDTSLTSLILGVESNYVTGERMFLGCRVALVRMYQCIHLSGKESSYENKHLSLVGMYPS